MQTDVRDAESVYASAVKKEVAQNYNAAFTLYLEAADLFLHNVRTAQPGSLTEKKKAQWKANAGKALERAEKIRLFAKKTTSTTSQITGTSPPVHIQPVAVDIFSPQQQSRVLQKSMVVNGRAYRAWERAVEGSSDIFSDPDGQPALSEEQVSRNAVWAQSMNPPHLNLSALPEHILQQVVSDCSVCASIAISVEHIRRFGLRILQPIQSNLAPGRYDIKCFFNGMWRRITVDEMLPHHPDRKSLMCMTCHSESGLIVWPSILEKAYLKLMGGYDFPGSNSCIDMHALTGWIPEQIDLHQPNFAREATWTALYQAYQAGSCVLTIGTGHGNDGPPQWRDIPLLAAHNYAIMDITETDGLQLLKVLDSWGPQHGGDQASSRVLSIPWHEAVSTFEGIYVNWDPARWQTSLQLHCLWEPEGGETSATQKLQVNFGAETPVVPGEEIWVHLTRHTRDSHVTDDFVSMIAEFEDELTSMVGDQLRPSTADVNNYTNSTHVLVKLKVPPSLSRGSISISALYDGSSTGVGFTLAVYSNIGDMNWNRQVQPAPFSRRLTGAFTSSTAGGNSLYPTFMNNPQYHLNIKSKTSAHSEKTNVFMTLRSDRHLPVNLTVVWSKGGRVFELSQRDIVAQSGPYIYGLARLHGLLDVGDYTITVSTFAPNQLGNFGLTVETSSPVEVSKIDPEGAGMYIRTASGTWDENTAAGGPSYGRYTENPIFELKVDAPMQLKVRLQTLLPSAGIPLNVTIYPAPPPSPTPTLGHHLSTSGPYDDTISGVTTTQTAFRAGIYWIIPSTHNPGLQASFQLLLYGTSSGFRIASM